MGGRAGGRAGERVGGRAGGWHLNALANFHINRFPLDLGNGDAALRLIGGVGISTIH